MMNWKKHAYLSYATLRGYRFPALLKQYLREYNNELSGETRARPLSRLLHHCREMVPYYADLLAGTTSDEIDRNPRGCLQKLPLLTKALIRANFERLQSKDNARRHCETNTSGGSTGEPVRLIQDDEYRDASTAIQWLSHHQLGCPLGAPHVRLWGSERDLESGTKSRKARFFNWLTNTTWLNAFAMSPERMREFIQVLNRKRPRLVVAYAQSIYELSRFAEREQIPVTPQRAVLTSAGTLYPFMREKIAQVFRCEVYNLYGSREVSDIAWELPGLKGLWAPPWANFIEIVDEQGVAVPAGVEGNIVVTCLTNLAMPLVRYWIGDRGALLPESEPPEGIQMLSHVSGRTVDTFRRSDQTLVDGEYFTHLLYFRPWVWKFQVVQRSYTDILFRVVSTNGRPPKDELQEIVSRSRLAMGNNCNVEFEFCEDLPPLRSGKFRYTISEVCA
jgi:phenylacetate-coenzyme A ligase PaaK-like adenylate-forming protein